MKADRRFPAAKVSVPAARQFAAGALNGVSDGIRDSVTLMVSELAMNAVQYAQTEFTVQVELTGGMLRVEVADLGAGTPQLCPVPPISSPHGRGLLIVSKLADQWGVTPASDGTGKSVWFQIATSHQHEQPDPLKATG